MADAIEALLPAVTAVQGGQSVSTASTLAAGAPRASSPTRHHRKGQKGSSLADTLASTVDRYDSL